MVKKQLRTEDGIFGTSGGFGFTKANELFVGRVAMLGFAASLLGEAVTGQGILSQLNLETGIPITEAEPLLLFFIAFTVLGAIGGLGDRGRFVDDEAPAGPPVKPGSFKAALGLSDDGPLFGFTKANELFVGRMAQLGFAASLIGEVITGRGALAQLNIETGLPIFELEPLLLASISLRCTHDSRKVWRHPLRLPLLPPLLTWAAGSEGGAPSSAPPFCRRPSVSRCLLTHDSTPPSLFFLFFAPGSGGGARQGQGVECSVRAHACMCASRTEVLAHP
ncbi:unnamed protein product [Closterium sp. Naga37s-1]|nr:unnamed protein product [Closterium sp. Naga37s-1]